MLKRVHGTLALFQSNYTQETNKTDKVAQPSCFRIASRIRIRITRLRNTTTDDIRIRRFFRIII